jgi:NCAIR mutase (PurE)-related protein
LRPDELRALLARVRRGAVTPAAAARAIAGEPLERLGFATLDHERALRTGVPEVVFGPGKTPSDLVAIVGRLYARSGLVLITRAEAAGADALKKAYPGARLYERCGAVVLSRIKPRLRGRVVVVCAGTADLPVAEEAAVTAETLGSRVELVADVGVAGLHRLLAHRAKLRAARVVVVVAGLEGALPSVVGGLVDRPVIAVPTAVGYGAHFGGLAPLLAMLNSCAPGVTVVNVNNGFGAGYAAHLVNAGAAPHGPAPRAAQPGKGRRVVRAPGRNGARARPPARGSGAKSAGRTRLRRG